MLVSVRAGRRSRADGAVLSTIGAGHRPGRHGPGRCDSRTGHSGRDACVTVEMSRSRGHLDGDAVGIPMFELNLARFSRTPPAWSLAPSPRAGLELALSTERHSASWPLRRFLADLDLSIGAGRHRMPPVYGTAGRDTSRCSAELVPDRAVARALSDCLYHFMEHGAARTSPQRRPWQSPRQVKPTTR